MATRETRHERGRRRGDLILRRIAGEMRSARHLAGVGQESVARLSRWSQTEISRFERGQCSAVSIPRLSELASLLGLDLSVGLHSVGDPISDSGQQAATARFLVLLSPRYRYAREVLLPNPGDRRSWDLLLRLDTLRIGVDVETRIRDVQALVRRIRERERDSGVDDILVVLSDTTHNRRLVTDFREALGPRYMSSPRILIRALRAGHPLPGSGVILV